MCTLHNRSSAGTFRCGMFIAGTFFLAIFNSSRLHLHFVSIYWLNSCFLFARAGGAEAIGGVASAGGAETAAHTGGAGSVVCAESTTDAGGVGGVLGVEAGGAGGACGAAAGLRLRLRLGLSLRVRVMRHISTFTHST